jgi:SH3-like domain-containing protein
MMNGVCRPGRKTTYIGSIFLALCLHAVLAGTVWAERMSVNADKANIRSGPGTEKYDVLWEVERYHPLDVIRKQGEWVFFRDFEGDEGWIHGSLLDKTATVITRSDMVNIRSGPGTQNDIVFKAERGVPFEVVKRQGDWIHIRRGAGDEGWIHKNLVW